MQDLFQYFVQPKYKSGVGGATQNREIQLPRGRGGGAGSPPEINLDDDNWGAFSHASQCKFFMYMYHVLHILLLMHAY